MTTEEQYQLRSGFFDEAESIFTIYDKDLNFIDANEAALKVLRLKREELIGKNLVELSPDVKSKGRYDLYMEVIRTGKTIVIDEVRPHTSLGNLHLRIKAFKVGEGMGMAITNISDLKETIDELETFIYKSSHDMRSPIASILGLLNVAMLEVKKSKPAVRYFTIVKEQTERLDKVLRHLLETIKIRQGEKTLHPVDFETKINEVITSLAFMKGFDRIRFEKDVRVTQKFYSDKSMLTSLFQNLIDNAVKYQKHDIPDSFIRISVTDEENGVKIVISDNGIGIPDGAKADVFKMFFRATNNASGSGLGLYTVNHCIKKLNGRISLESRENEGTTFTVYLPNEKP